MQGISLDSTKESLTTAEIQVDLMRRIEAFPMLCEENDRTIIVAKYQGIPAKRANIPQSDLVNFCSMIRIKPDYRRPIPTLFEKPELQTSTHILMKAFARKEFIPDPAMRDLLWWNLYCYQIDNCYLDNGYLFFPLVSAKEDRKVRLTP